MRKYTAMLKVSFQDAMEYRVEAAIWFLYDVVPPFMMVFLWTAAYQEGETAPGFTLAGILTYYLAMLFLRTMVTPHVEWTVDWDVRMGYLSRYLIRPVNVWGFWLASEVAWKGVRLFLLLPVLVGAMVLLAPYLTMPSLGPWEVLASLVSVVMAFILCFFLKLNLGLTAFWLLDVGAVAWLYEAVVMLSSGTWLPLELLPPALASVARLLPFQYVYYFPANLLLGRVHGAELAAGLAGQVLWVLAAYLLARALWPLALRRYEAVGG